VNTIATPAPSNGGPYCDGATISLSTPLVGGATYAWTGPNGFTSTLRTPTRANGTAADSGAYSATITVGGCASLAGTTNVVVHAIPAAPAASNSGPYCAGGTISLPTPTRANATAADAGTYSVTVTVGGCASAAGTTSVVVNAMPATPTASNGGPYCAGGTISLSTPAVTGATYAWTGPGGFTSSLQNPTRANATTAFAGTYSLSITVSGCTSAIGTTNVVVNSLPS